MSLNLHHQHQQQQQQPAGKREQRLTAGSNLADTANAPATVLFSARLLPFRDCHLIIAMCNLSLFSRKNGPRRDNGGPRTPPSVSLSFSLSSSEFDHLSLDFSILDSDFVLLRGIYVNGYELVVVEREEFRSRFD